MDTSEQQKVGALAEAARLAGREDEALQRAMRHLWDVGFEQGRLAALDELQDRFCVCMK
jgi:predicted transcriptional regulator